MKAEIERFVKALRTALIGPPELSQRDLCAAMGVSIGSMSKYLRGEVAPGKVGLSIQSKLAKVLGHSLDSLMLYYETGEWDSDLTLEDVTSWLQSQAGAEDFAAVMQSLAVASSRVSGAAPAEKKAEPWMWPLQALKEAGITDKLREKMGLTDDKLWSLANDGKWDDDLVEAFSVATNYEEEAVREAFAKQQPLV